MLQCILTPEKSQKKHCQNSFFLTSDRERNGNRLSHMASYHPFILEEMTKLEKTQTKTELYSSANHFIAAAASKFGSPSVSNCFIKTTKEKQSELFPERFRKKISILLQLAETDSSFETTQSKMWKVMWDEHGISDIPSTHDLSSYLPAIAHIVTLEREEILKTAGFCHVLYDLYNCLGDDYLLITYQTTVENQVIQFPLDAVKLYGSKTKTNVSRAVDLCLDKHLGNEVEKVSVHVDGALLASARLVVSEAAIKWCFNHEFSLMLTTDTLDDMSLNVSQEIDWIHHVMVCLKSHKLIAAAVADARRDRGLQALSPLLDHDIRWSATALMIRRFVIISDDIANMITKNPAGLGQQLETMIKDHPYCPKDFFSQNQWRRIEKYKDILSYCYIVSVHAQSRSTVVISRILFWVDQVQELCTEAIDDHEDVIQFKKKLFSATLTRFMKYTTEKSIVLQATALDPRFADLRRWFSISESKVNQIWEEIAKQCRNDFEQNFKDTSDDSEAVKQSRKEGLLAQLTLAISFARKYLEIKSKEIHLKKNEPKFEENVIHPIDPLVEWATVPELNSNLWLLKRANMLLSSPAGTAGTEAVGSDVKRIRTPARNRLSDTTVQQLLVIRSYINEDSFSFDNLIKKLKSVMEAEENNK